MNFGYYQNNARSITLSGGIVGSEHGVSGSSNDIGGLIRHLNQLEEDIKDQLRLLELRGKHPKDTVYYWLDELQDLKRRAGDMNQLESSQIQILTEELEQHKTNMPLVVSNEFVGKKFEDNVWKIWELLRDDKVFIIGIHGMGGVGKTFLATYMENEIKRNKAFNHVLCVTVSHDFTVFKLQQQIAERMGVNLYGDDERTRATILASELEKIENSVLILDDVWRYIDLEKVGIPLKMNGIKLIVTSRLKHVCQQMDCQPYAIVTMDCLMHSEGWELFLLKFGHHWLPPEVEEIAKSALRKCYGLPLAISVMARTMKGKYDIHWWKHAFNKLEDLEMEEEILTVLKRSCDYLTEKVLQKCFLHSALFSNLESKSDLVIKVVGEMLNEKRSLEKLIDEGFVIIDELIQHSLLLEYGFKYIKMHDLVRNMACHILNESRSCMVKCGQELINIPDKREWTVDLEIISLAGNEIQKIPEGTSPACPRLSTLILSLNCISHIPESFFTDMNALTLLDLSYNYTLTSLPNSLSNLKLLISLLLKGCSKLKYIPPLGELQALSKLDISGCCLDQVPLGLENLINLKWLDLSRNGNKITLPEDVLSCLTNMRYLDVRHCSNLKAEDMKGMRMLECFAGCFQKQDNYNNYVRQTLNKDYGPKTYFIRFKDEDYEYEDHNNYNYDYNIMYEEFNRRRLYIRQCTELPYLLPRDLVDLRVYGNNKWEYLCAALSSMEPPPLETIQINRCKVLKRLFCLDNACSICTFIQSQYNADFHILDHQARRMNVFRHITHFKICKCHEIEMLLTPELVSPLGQLKSIKVESCRSMKEIFGDSLLQVKLPNLTTLCLYNLPELHTVCKQVLLCASHYALDIKDCPNLKQRPTIVLQ